MRGVLPFHYETATNFAKRDIHYVGPYVSYRKLTKSLTAVNKHHLKFIWIKWTYYYLKYIQGNILKYWLDAVEYCSCLGWQIFSSTAETVRCQFENLDCFCEYDGFFMWRIAEVRECCLKMWQIGIYFHFYKFGQNIHSYYIFYVYKIVRS